MSWMRWLPRLAARVPANIHAKLVAAFLALVSLLLLLGGVSLQTLVEGDRRVDELLQLQRDIAAYRQLQHDTTAQLYSVASALLVPEEATLEATLRQLQQFGYDVERLQVAARGEVELFARVQADYEEFLGVVERVVELTRRGKAAEGREFQVARATPLAEAIERRMNELVNRAEAEMLDHIDANHRQYLASRWWVGGFALGSIALALLLGYAIAWSLIAPVKDIDARLDEIAAGDFSRHVVVPNRDELGGLAAKLNRMNDELGRLYQQRETAHQQLEVAHRQLEAANQELETTNQRLETINLQLERTNQELETVSRHKSQFLANMSHELRTPLNAIIGFSEVLDERMFGELNPKQAEYVHDIYTSGCHLHALINDILDLAKIEAGRMELQPAPFDLHLALDNALTLVRERAQRRAISLELQAGEALGEIVADERKLKQILLNLLSNALKFTPEGGRITVRAQRLPEVVEVAVADTGIGIAAADQELIFEEFRQAQPQPGQAREGTGLGLALTRRFVEMHGGHIRVDSTPGEGATFTFNLPVVQS
jgi:signal transduction histidine kinase